MEYRVSDTEKSSLRKLMKLTLNRRMEIKIRKIIHIVSKTNIPS